jgi:hypothetical protein
MTQGLRPTPPSHSGAESWEAQIRDALLSQVHAAIRAVERLLSVAAEPVAGLGLARWDNATVLTVAMGHCDGSGLPAQ